MLCKNNISQRVKDQILIILFPNSIQFVSVQLDLIGIDIYNN